MEPSPIFIDPRGQESADKQSDWVLITRKEWADIGGYIFSSQAWIRSAGPCLGRTHSDTADVPKAGTGAVRQ